MIKVEDLLTFYNWNTTHINMGKCHQLKEEGYLHMKKHVKYPLYLLNYTSKTQYQQKWCKELIHTRGMVVEEDGQIKTSTQIFQFIRNCWMERVTRTRV